MPQPVRVATTRRATITWQPVVYPASAPSPAPAPSSPLARPRPIHYALRTRKLLIASLKFRFFPPSPLHPAGELRPSCRTHAHSTPCRRASPHSVSRKSAWAVAMASERLPSRPACLLVASGASEGEAHRAAVWLSGPAVLTLGQRFCLWSWDSGTLHLFLWRRPTMLSAQADRDDQRLQR